jgi:chromosome segregation ATPase
MAGEPDTPRAKLSLAITRFTSARQRVEQLEAAQPEAMQRRIEARKHVEELASALRRVREAEEHDLVEALVTGTAERSAIADTTASLQSAEAAYEMARRVSDSLDRTLANDRRDLSWQRARLGEAVAAVVLDSDELTTLLDARQEALRALSTIEFCLGYLRARNCLPASQRPSLALSDDPSQRDLDPALRIRYERWLSALERDASAELDLEGTNEHS